MSKHTPGPWRLYGRTVADINTKVICEIGSRGIRLSKADFANGNLIAMTPELLSALREMVGAQNAGPMTDEMYSAWKNAKAVIAEATKGTA
jgi:hypothetical protein